MELPTILKEENVEAAAELLGRSYLEPSTKTGLLSTGSYLDEWASRGDGPEVRNRITDSDAVAVSMLSVKVPAQAIIGLQEKTLAADIEKLLAEIPTDMNMSDLTAEEAQARLGSGSPAVLLWTELRRTRETRWDVGATIASKILARKRPHLIPIWDKVIGAVVGERTARNQWLNWHNLFMEDPDLARPVGAHSPDVHGPDTHFRTAHHGRHPVALRQGPGHHRRAIEHTRNRQLKHSYSFPTQGGPPSRSSTWSGPGTTRSGPAWPVSTPPVILMVGE